MIPAAIEAFWDTIPPVWDRIKGNIRSIAVENYDNNVEQFHILRHIRKGLTSVSELAEVKQISRLAISQAVDVLVERGLSCRLQNAGTAGTFALAGRTSFVIAHRLSTIRDANHVLVINNGGIVEQGTHQELLDKKGFYHHLYLSQFKGQAI